MSRKRKAPELQDLTEKDLELTQFKCPRCEVTHKTTSELFTHMRSMHAEPKKCLVCDKKFNCMARFVV